MHTSLINVYGVIQKVKYDGKESVSPDIDSEDTEDKLYCFEMYNTI